MDQTLFGNPELYFAKYENNFKNPALIAETLAILKDPLCEADKLMRILEREPGVTAKLLRVANSAFYGNPRSITSLKAAIMRLGNQNIARIALMASLSSRPTQNWFPFWIHSVAVSMLSRHIAEYMKIYSRQEQEEFFSMGLLHDLGLLVEIAAGDFNVLSEHAAKNQCTIEEAETALLGFNHEQLGAVIALKWGFPGDLLNAMSHHHQPDLAGDYSKRILPVHVADIICHGFKMTISSDEKAPATDEKFLHEIRIPVEQLPVFGEWILNQKEEIQAFGKSMSV